MNFEHLAQYIDFGLGLLLVSRLLILNLHRVYLVFSLFLLSDLLGSALWMVRSIPGSPLKALDYRLIWLADRMLVWLFMFWTVFALLDAVLFQFPGIIRISRRVLRYCFLISLALAILSALPEYSASAVSNPLANWPDQALIFGLVAERVVSSVSLLAILTLLTFLLWFPVEIPRNLAVFVAGFVVYFSVMNLVLLARSFWSHDLIEFASIAGSVVAGVCFAYWALFISTAGEKAVAKMTVPWKAQEQDRLLARLELLNESLLRAARR